mmetsp:Transcript_21121/g.47876  ORF Transcript_21121/g.47876 Transcript_21121/m.47876 type:complete len:413 (-) Transcript_21121:543-1781(-)
MNYRSNIFDEGGVTSDQNMNHVKIEIGSVGENPNEREDIVFIFHVGPPKSGTSTIQSDLSQPKIKNLLRQDNYEYIGHNKGVLSHKRLLRRNETSGRIEFSAEFKDVISEQRKIGRNVLGSDERYWNLCPEKAEEWRKMFSKLHIVLTYRRTHSFLPSVWNQNFKNKREKGNPPSSHKDWPGINHDYRIPSFPEHFAKVYYEKPFPHLVRTSYNYWKKYADRFTLVNFHEEDPTTNFLCKAVIGANNTCALMRIKKKEAQEFPSTVKNPSVNLDYDMVAVHAYEIGLVHRTHRRRAVARAVQEHAAATGISFPQKCLDTRELDHLYRRSLADEAWAQSMFGEWGAGPSRSDAPSMSIDADVDLLGAEELAEFNADWKNSKEQGKFCSVDVFETLKQKKWRKFFKTKFKERAS